MIPSKSLQLKFIYDPSNRSGACSSDEHVALVVVHAVVGLMFVLIARVIVVVFVVEFP